MLIFGNLCIFCFRFKKKEREDKRKGGYVLNIIILVVLVLVVIVMFLVLVVFLVFEIGCFFWVLSGLLEDVEFFVVGGGGCVFGFFEFVLFFLFVVYYDIEYYVGVEYVYYYYGNEDYDWFECDEEIFFCYEGVVLVFG